MDSNVLMRAWSTIPDPGLMPRPKPVDDEAEKKTDSRPPARSPEEKRGKAA